MNIFSQKKLINCTFFFIFLMGLYFSKDYGVSWDENYHRKNGKENLAYVLRFLSLDNILQVPKHVKNPQIGIGGYGPIFDILCFFSEKLLVVKDSKNVFLLRHKVNFIIYFLGVFMFYLFLRKIFKSQLFGFVGAMFYFLSPRLFANGFYNPKDSISQAVLACSLLPLYLTYKNKNQKMSLLAGILLGIAITVRLPILYLPCLFILLLSYKSLKEGKLFKIEDQYKTIEILFAVSTITSTLIFFPVLWEAPLNNFKIIFNNLNQHPWKGNNLFMGELIPASNLPWYYLPIWILVTTPFSFVFLLIAGIFKSFKNILDSNIRDNLFYIFMLAGLIVPIASVIILNSTLYNGWRHLYFVYPFMAFFMSIGFQWIYKWLCLIFSKDQKKVLILLLFITFINPLYFIFRTHPNQQVYFNKFAGSYPLENFEGDYLAVSMFQAIDWIIKNNSKHKINVLSPLNAAARSNILLERNDQEKLNFLAIEPMNELNGFANDSTVFSNDKNFNILPNYLITNSRLEMEGFSKHKKSEVFNVSSGSLKLWSLYTLD